MKKLALILILLSQISVSASPIVFSEDGKFGLKEGENIVVEAKYKKLIRLGDSGWIVQEKNKFGVMSNSGKILVEPKYNQAERVLGRFAKLRKGDKYGLFDENGFTILEPVYSSIDLLFGGMFLTCKNYKYGVTDFNGRVILDNIFDNIYTPKPNMMVIEYNGQIYEITYLAGDMIELPQDIASIKDSSDFLITEILNKPVTTTGYYGIAATNYLLKIFSSISPAYEETIDELMFSQGADAASVIMKCAWIPCFPFVYAKRYYKNLTAPNNGPLSGVKKNLRKELTE